MKEIEVSLATRRRLPFGDAPERLRFQLPAPLPCPLIAVEVVSNPNSVLICVGR